MPVRMCADFQYRSEAANAKLAPMHEAGKLNKTDPLPEESELLRELDQIEGETAAAQAAEREREARREQRRRA